MSTLAALALLIAVQPGPEIGRPAPPIDFKIISAPNGAKADLESLKGKVVILEFWATWCPPCIKAIPHMNELAEKFRGEPVRFLNASIESDDEAAVEKFLKKNEMKGWVGVVSAATAKTYKIVAVPETIVIDKKGNVAAFSYPTEITEEVIRDLLAGKHPGLRNRRLSQMVPTKAADMGAPGKDTDSDEFSFTIQKVSAKKNAMRMGSLGSWSHAGGDVQTLISMIFQKGPGRVSVDGDVGSEVFSFEMNFPAGMKSPQRFTKAREILPKALGVKVEQQKKTTNAYVLVCPAGPSKELAKTDSPGHAGMGPGFSSGNGALVRLMAEALELDLGVPVLDETGLQGYFNWNLSYKSGSSLLTKC